ncbi:hypothetical protein ACFE04_022389 [Oxalis oulophora]
MVEVTQQNQQPQATPAEEALKRNTDCVYFLASPLTCKKGSECEYRHSDYVRLNPRDCYYWLNGNCLNPKCGFRHPPLDGLIGTQAASGSVVAPPQPAVALPIPLVAYNSGKQGVACHFFQKGQCIKGDKCPFSHGPPNHFGNKSSQATPPPAHEKKISVGLQKCSTEERKVPPPKAALEVKLAPRTETDPSRNVQPLPRKEVPRYRAPIVSSVGNSNLVTRSNRTENAYDGDELLRETSPGFDVLVDDELRGSDYYQGEDQFGRRSVEKYNNVDRSSDSRVGVFGGYEQMEGQYGWEQQQQQQHPDRKVEKRGYLNSDRVPDSDLRYRLSKHRGSSNGLRSVVSRDNRSEERITPYRSSHESSMGSRLRGRIRLPERDARSRYSPPIASSHRLRDRMKERVVEGNEFNNNDEGRNFRGRMMRTDERRSDFAAPKSLAELKAKNSNYNAENDNNSSLVRKRKSLDDDHLPSEGAFPFEGPKPLSEILKRKRGAPPPAYTVNNNEEKNNKIATAEMQDTMQSSEQETVEDYGIEEHEIVGDEQLEGEYEYEQQGGDEEGEYFEEEGTYEEGEEGAYEEEEYVEEGEEGTFEEEEEEGEDISKKIDGMLS